MKPLNVVTINAERSFAGAGNKIFIPNIRFLLHTVVGDLSKSKKLRNWAALDAVLLPPLITKAVVL